MNQTFCFPLLHSLHVWRKGRAETVMVTMPDLLLNFFGGVLGKAELRFYVDNKNIRY